MSLYDIYKSVTDEKNVVDSFKPRDVTYVDDVYKDCYNHEHGILHYMSNKSHDLKVFDEELSAAANLCREILKKDPNFVLLTRECFLNDGAEDPNQAMLDADMIEPICNHHQGPKQPRTPNPFDIEACFDPRCGYGFGG